MGRASETLSKVQWSQELSGFVKLPKMSYGPTANAGLQVEEKNDILAHFDYLSQIYVYIFTFYRPKLCRSVPKKTNTRYDIGFRCCSI